MRSAHCRHCDRLPDATHDGGHEFEPRLTARDALALTLSAVNSVDDTITAPEAISLIRMWLGGVPGLSPGPARIDPAKPLVSRVLKRGGRA